MLRLAAALALLVGVTGLLGYLHLVGKGPTASLEARHLRDMKDRTEEPDTLAPISFHEFAALPEHRSVAEYSALERRGVALEGWVQRMLVASDGDFHIELAPRPPVPGGRDTVYATAEITPQWRRGAPAWGFEPLLAALRPQDGGPRPWSAGPRRVRLGGWLLYDAPAVTRASDRGDGTAARPKTQRISKWEIHPVTRVELWDEERNGFVELPR
jgi:hypothetical protein